MQNISNNPMSRPFTFEGSKAHGVLVLHGFTATPGTVLPLGEAIAKEGHYVRGILLPGHGTVIQDMENTRWHDWLTAALQTFDEMSAICEKVSVVGLSMGGTLTLLLAEQRPVYKAVPIAAALKPIQKHTKLARFVWRVKPYMFDEAPKNKPDFLNEYNLSYCCTPVRNVPDLNRLMSMAKSGLPKITCPILAVQAGQDQSVHPDSAKWIILRSSSTQKQLIVLPKSPHVCTLGCERELLFQKVTDFLKT